MKKIKSLQWWADVFIIAALFTSFYFAFVH